MGVRSEAGRVVRESWREVHDENITFMAGSIAYYAFVSMLSLLVFLLVVLSAVGSEAVTASLVETTEQFLTPYARRLLVDSLDITTARTGVSVVGVITLLWGASKIFHGLDVAFSEIYGIETNKTLFRRFENAVVVFGALAVAVVAFLVAGGVFALVPDLPYPSALHPLFLVVGLAVAFFPVYYVFPDADVTPREVLPGAVVAAVGWTALEAAFQGYVTYAARYEAVYGALGSAFLLLVWLYFGSLVLLFGGVVNAVLAGKTGDKHALGVASRESNANASADDGGGPAAVGTDELGGASDRLGRAGNPSPAHRGHGGSDGQSTLDRTQGQFDRTEDSSVRDDAPDADRRRLLAEVRRLETENERLRRANDALTRRLARRRRSFVAQAKRRLFGK